MNGHTMLLACGDLNRCVTVVRGLKIEKKRRLLILSGHGSHIIRDFLDYCNNGKKISPHTGFTAEAEANLDGQRIGELAFVSTVIVQFYAGNCVLHFRVLLLFSAPTSCLSCTRLQRPDSTTTLDLASLPTSRPFWQSRPAQIPSSPSADGSPNLTPDYRIPTTLPIPREAGTVIRQMQAVSHSGWGQSDLIHGFQIGRGDRAS